MHEAQWRSQDVQVMWAQHGHTQCINTHLLRDLGNTPAMKTFIHFEIASKGQLPGNAIMCDT